jgi:hypothetical protein
LLVVENSISAIAWIKNKSCSIEVKMVSQKQINKARKMGQVASEPFAVDAWYDDVDKKICIELNTEILFIFPLRHLQGLENATTEELKKVCLTSSGHGLHWDELDVHFLIPQLIIGIFGTKAWMKELGRSLGASKSIAKTKSSRENGKLGGRPPQKSS